MTRDNNVSGSSGVFEGRGIRLPSYVYCAKINIFIKQHDISSFGFLYFDFS